MLLAQGAVGEAGAAKDDRPAKVTLGISTEKQRGLLKRGVLRVRVRTTSPTRVRVAASHAGRNGLFKSKTVRVEGRGRDAKKVRLPLTASGERKLSSCGAKLVKVTGEYRSGGKNRRSTATKNLRKDSNLCGGPYRPVPVENADRCDFLDPAVCLQPFPNDYFTRSDASTATGRRLNLNLESMPANDKGVPIDQTDMNRADGFSPGNLITIKVPEVETPEAFENTGFVPIDDLRAYDDPNQPVIVINAETGERQPIWAELDANPTSVDPSSSGPGGIGQDPTDTGPVNLLIRPAENFDFGERYIVALRNLRDENDELVEAPIGFRVYRDNDITDQQAVERRRPHMESVIDDLTDKAGVERDSLYMAWDFTVASRDSVTDRAVTIRDDAFARLGDTDLADRIIDGVSPDYTVTSVDDDPDDPNLTRVVDGTIDGIPCYLDVDGCPTGSEFAFGGGELTWNPAYETTAQFRCVIPASVETENPDSITPAVPGTYGHGLLGSYEQVRGQAQLGNESNTLWCAVDWAGFAEQDIATVIASLSDMSNFNKLVDRMQQGFVNFMYLGRALIHPDGMSTDPAFEIDPDGAGSEDPQSVIATDGADGRLNFMGISQGGIMGGALTALEPDVDRSVLNVPGMNYSTLLRRSVDSDEYFKIPGLGLYANYPSELERPLLLSLIQLLWDRGEGNGYAHNMTSAPLPGTNPHEVLLQPAIGDHQVANVTAEVEARTIGASVYTPALEPGRHWEENPFLGIPAVNVPATGPYTGGSMLVYYDGGPLGFVGNRDGGTATPPNENVPPRPEWGYGDDPHGYPRNAPDGRLHAGGFLAGDGIAPCASPSGYCFSNGYSGSP